jgi:hypothetical protein
MILLKKKKTMEKHLLWVRITFLNTRYRVSVGSQYNFHQLFENFTKQFILARLAPTKEK